MNRKRAAAPDRSVAHACHVRQDLAIGLLTGLVMPSRIPWDTPDTWWLDVLVTFVTHTGRRTDGYTMGVTMPAGAWWNEVMDRVRFLLTRMTAVEATITHVRRPMDAEMIYAIQELNAAMRTKRRATSDGRRVTNDERRMTDRNGHDLDVWGTENGND